MNSLINTHRFIFGWSRPLINEFPNPTAQTTCGLMLPHHSPPNRRFSNMPSLNRHLPNQHSPNQCLLIRHLPNRRSPNRHYLLSHLQRHSAVQSYQLSILHKFILIIIHCFQLPFIQTGQRHPFLVLHTTQLAHTSFIFKFNTFIYQSIIQFFLAT